MCGGGGDGGGDGGGVLLFAVSENDFPLTAFNEQGDEYNIYIG